MIVADLTGGGMALFPALVAKLEEDSKIAAGIARRENRKFDKAPFIFENQRAFRLAGLTPDRVKQMLADLRVQFPGKFYEVVDQRYGAGTGEFRISYPDDRTVRAEFVKAQNREPDEEELKKAIQVARAGFVTADMRKAARKWLADNDIRLPASEATLNPRFRPGTGVVVHSPVGRGYMGVVAGVRTVANQPVVDLIVKDDFHPNPRAMRCSLRNLDIRASGVNTQMSEVDLAQWHSSLPVVDSREWRGV